MMYNEETVLKYRYWHGDIIDLTIITYILEYHFFWFSFYRIRQVKPKLSLACTESDYATKNVVYSALRLEKHKAKSYLYGVRSVKKKIDSYIKS